MCEIKTTAKFICNFCDCVSNGNKGDPLVQSIFTKYPYANVYAERIATKKAEPGTLQIKGDGKKNRFIVNMFAQFYPLAPKYPNDNINRRLDWLNSCLNKLLEIADADSFAVPDHLGTYETSDYHPRYLSLIDDFQKKYYLKHHQLIKITDYQGNELLKENQSPPVNYAPPISVLRTSPLADVTEDDNDNNVNNDDTRPSQKPNIHVIQRIDLANLTFVPEISTVTTPTSTPTPPPTDKIKLKIGLKKPMLIETDMSEIVPHIRVTEVPLGDQPSMTPTAPAPVGDQSSSTPVVPSNIVTYDKNPTWTRKISELISDCDPSWEPIFKDPKTQELFSQLDLAFEKEMKGIGDFIEILPMPQNLIFNAFKQCKYPIKVCIIGQDVYAEQVNQAMGLSFSVQPGVKIPPSLVNIFQELSTDIDGFQVPLSGDLTAWAQQGVLLLNTALTVRHGHKESHIKLWKPLTDYLIQSISQHSDTPIVFMLWGNHAKGKQDLIYDQASQSGHLILTAAHPSPLSANKGGWFGCHHFSQCNAFLIQHGLDPIRWQLT